MMTPILFEDDLAFTGFSSESEAAGRSTAKNASKRRDEMHLLAAKLSVPTTPGLVKRRRLTDFLEKSARQIGANLISGRAETGKTYAAVDLAAKYDRVAWYSVDSADRDWATFASYLEAAVSGDGTDARIKKAKSRPSEADIAAYLTNIFASIEENTRKKPMLIVLDDLHHVFDAPWFTDLFKLLLSSLLPETHLLMLCRSKPPVPLWRLRSKQVLNVVDERFLAFDAAETSRLFKKLGFRKSASQSLPSSAGRIGKMVKLLRSASDRPGA